MIHVVSKHGLTDRFALGIPSEICEAEKLEALNRHFQRLPEAEQRAICHCFDVRIANPDLDEASRVISERTMFRLRKRGLQRLREQLAKYA